MPSAGLTPSSKISDHSACLSLLLRQHLKKPPQPAQYLVVFAGSHISTEIHQSRGIHKDHFKCLVEIIQDRLEKQTWSLVLQHITHTKTPQDCCHLPSLQQHIPDPRSSGSTDRHRHKTPQRAAYQGRISILR